MLDVRLIGKFDIKYDGKPITISSRIAQSLFAYLILTAGTLHRREKLAGMFWPDSSEEKARAYLRHELWRIRKALQDTPENGYIYSDDMNVSFDSSAEYGLDVAAFKNVSDKALADELVTGLSYYQGELLPGFYEDWVVSEREHLQAAYEKEIARLLELLENEKRWQEILDWAERCISFGETPEIAYRALMIAYDALGDRAKVASTYERCVKALREIDLEPSEQTRSLAFKRASSLNIPIPLTSFIGREKELKEVADFLSKTRLVTLTGSGGVGKTRLAIQVVADVLDLFPGSVWFLDLAHLKDPSLVPNILAGKIGLPESGELPVTELLINYFHSRTALVIFDNCEHLIEACAQLINVLLSSCRNLFVLATSREALRISGEIPYRVPSLEIPKPDIELATEEISNMESVKLFAERATVTSPEFAISPQNAFIIAQICQRLDGIPLAIELAAARVNMLTVEQIARRLDDRFNLLTHGLRSALPRHQTLRATFEWSYSLLSEQERILLRRLAVFMGGWTLEAAEQICLGSNDVPPYDVLDLLTHLVDKSLVIMDKPQLRYHMLETTHQYAREKLLDSGEGKTLGNQHLAFFLRLAEVAEPKLTSREQHGWRVWLEADHQNLRAALGWALELEEAETALRLSGALWQFWELRGSVEEGRTWLNRALSVSGSLNSQAMQIARATALYRAGFLANYQGNHKQAEELCTESLSQFQALGNARGIGWAKYTLGMIRLFQYDYALAAILLEESLALFRELGDARGIGWATHNLGLAAIEQGNHARASVLLEESLELFRELGDLRNVAISLGNLGNLAQELGNNSEAEERFVSALELLQQSGEKGTAIVGCLLNLGALAQVGGDVARAERLIKEGIKLAYEMGVKTHLAFGLTLLAWVAVVEGKHERATRLLGVAAAQHDVLTAQIGRADRAAYEHQLATIKSQLNETTFNVLWSEGCGMTMEQAIKLAFEIRHN